MKPHLFLPLLITGASLTLARAADWKPAPVTLMTSWGSKVTPENAWPEHPRPQMVRAQWLNLNGMWDYAITPRSVALPSGPDGQILVPFCVESALSGVGKVLQPDQRLWYRRTFTIPSGWEGKRVLLHFGAVDYEMALWVNGGLVGSHTGGFDSFSFDITPFLRAGENEVLLGVTDPTSTGEQPRGKQVLEPRGIWYTPVSGIWQTVWLEPVPDPTHLAELRLTPDLARGGLHVEALANTAVNDDSLGVRLTAAADGKTVSTTIMRVNRRGFLPVPEARLWSPDSPFLYDLKAELVRVKNPHAGRDRDNRLVRHGESERKAYAATEVEGEPIDNVTSYFAMREIRLGPGKVANQPVLLLNGEPLFQHGPLDQGWWPDGLHTPPSDEAMAWELAWLRKAGFNMLRKHIKVEPDRYYYHCDRLGMMVWQDMPSGFNEALRNGREDEGEPVRLSTSRSQHELELRRMLDHLHNHPSIVMWVIHNEGWGQYQTAELTGWVRSLDPSRLVNATSGWLDMGVSHVYDIHSYQPVPNTPENKPDRAIVVGEYGGVGWPIQEHLWNPQMRNWGYQTYQSEAEYIAAVRTKIEGIIDMAERVGVSAAVYTQTSDVEGEVNGLLTYDRKVVKIEPTVLAEMNRKLGCVK